MSVEAQRPTAVRHARPKSIFAYATTFYLLAAAAHLGLMLLFTLPPIFRSCTRLGWWLGPYRSLPYPLGFHDAWRSFCPDPGVLLALLPIYILALTLAVAATHTAILMLVIWANAWLGHPRYWRELRPRFRVLSLRAASARRCWWVWPVGQLVWLFWEQVALGDCFGLTVSTDRAYLLANGAAIAIVMAIMTNRAVRESILAAVARDDRRCSRCEYLLRGLETLRCPECGHDNGASAEPAYRLRLPGIRLPSQARVVLLTALLTAMLFAPLWLPAALMRIPRPWLRYVPAAIRPDWWLLNRDPNEFPIRVDTACVIRHEGSIAVVTFTLTETHEIAYEAFYWSDAKTFGPATPFDDTAKGLIEMRPRSFVPIGPWQFHPSGNSETMFWLMRPDNTYSIKAYERDRLPEELQWINRSEP